MIYQKIPAITLVMCLLSLRELQSFRITSIRNNGRGSVHLPRSTQCAALLTTEGVTEEVIQEARSMMPEIVDKMPDPLPTDLKNQYYMLRHGQSTANIAEIISSSRSLAYSEKHGLTAFGYEQGKDSANELLDILEKEGASGQKVVFVSSPFARAKQTAEACLDGLMGSDENKERIALYDGTSHKYHTLDLQELNETESKLQRAMNKIKDRKNALIKKKFYCIICYDRPKCMQFIDGCDHIVICQECAEEINDRKCPLCREPYLDTKKMFLA